MNNNHITPPGHVIPIKYTVKVKKDLKDIKAVLSWRLTHTCKTSLTPPILESSETGRHA